MQANAQFIGIDVARAELVVGCGGQVSTLRNEAPAIAQWVGRLPAGSVLAVESSGGYEQAVLVAAHAAGHRCYLLNPADVRHYARAVGLRSKTDRVDALLLARYVQAEHAHLHPWQPPAALQRELEVLLRRRALLVKTRQQVRLALAEQHGLLRSAQPLLTQYAKLLRTLERQIRDKLALLTGAAQHLRLLRSIPGIGWLNAAYLANLLSRIDFARSDALVAFAGLDPRARDSGTLRGRRRLSKRGPALMRQLLYNAAMAAARSESFKPMKTALAARGLPITAIYIIIARKLLRIALAVFKSQTPFDPAKVGAST
jgi:transposase